VRWRGDTKKYNAVIIGASIGGLVAAAYLARAKARVVLFEAGEQFGGAARTHAFAPSFRGPLHVHTAFALDGRAVRELRLAAHGLDFAQTDMKLIGLGPAGKHVAFPDGSLRARAALAASWGSDGLAYGAFHDEATRLARLLRPLWDGTLADPAAPNTAEAMAVVIRRLRAEDSDAERIEELSRISATAFLDRWFDDGALKAALAFDVFPSGLSPHEPGSALPLIWRYAQDGSSLPGACQIRGGPSALTAALVAAAREAGAELHAGKSVGSIVVEKRRTAGVILTDGEMISADCVLSSLDARDTLLGLVPASSGSFGLRMRIPPPKRLTCAQVLVALSAPPPFAGLAPHELGARFVAMERGEIADEAKGVALTGGFPGHIALEATVPTIADSALAPSGQHVLSALVPYLPAQPNAGWARVEKMLRRRVLETLEDFAPGLRDRVIACAVITPENGAGCRQAVSLFASPGARLSASYEARIRTPITGLYLCGRAAEPVDAISGRAGRVAAGLVFMGSRQGASA